MMETAADIQSPFSGLLGQKKAKALLQRSLDSGRIAHAYLFRGPDGVGKVRYATAMARALNCRTAGPSAWCGTCPSCRKFLSGNHPDFHVERPEKGTIKIDRVRELIKSLSFAPYESDRRVIVMEDIHTMRAEAANSLLKTLEEPPENNILILTAEASQGILPTITSRCQVVPFFPLSDDETTTILMQHGEFPDEEAHLLARLAEGSPGKALTLQKLNMVELRTRVIAALENTEQNPGGTTLKLLQLAEELAALQEHLPVFLGLLRLWLHDALLALPVSSGTAAEHIWARLEAINLAERQLARNCGRTQVCEILLFRLQ